MSWFTLTLSCKAEKAEKPPKSYVKRLKAELTHE